MNFQAFKDHLFARRTHPSADKSRNGSSIRSRRRSDDSTGSGPATEDPVKKRLMGLGLDEEKHYEEERMLDIAE